MVRPDPREAIWYDINNILKMPSDVTPNYWTILIGNFRMLDDNVPRPICKICNNYDLFSFKDKLYCSNGWDYELDIDNKKGTVSIKNVKRIDNKNHKIVYETTRQTINRILNQIFDMLEEIGGFRYDLLTLENALFGTPDDFYFETKYGDIPKRVVKNWLYEIEKVIRDRLIELRTEIRFTSMMRTPPIRMVST